jgi:hypothetical protein
MEVLETVVLVMEVLETAVLETEGLETVEPMVISGWKTCIL